MTSPKTWVPTTSRSPINGTVKTIHYHVTDAAARAIASLKHFLINKSRFDGPTSRPTAPCLWPDAIAR